jgi:hypothetical protein
MVGMEVSVGVSAGNSVGLEVPEGVIEAGPTQLERRSAMHKPRSVHLLFMGLLITRDEKGVNAVIWY